MRPKGPPRSKLLARTYRALDTLLDATVVLRYGSTGNKYRRSLVWDHGDLDVDLSRKVCAITGANSGIGLAAARQLTLDEALAQGWMRVTEVTEGGSVPTLLVQNIAPVPVLILDGEELVGAKQNRVVNLTILVPAQAKITIPVSCVEAGRWSAQSAAFMAAPRTQHPSARAMKARDVTASLRETGQRHSNQGAIWDDIAHKSARLGVHSDTSAASAMYERYDHHLDRFEKGFRPVARQVGAVFAIDGAIVGLDLFDAERTWRKAMSKLVRGYGLDAVDSRTVGRPDAEPNVRSFLDVVAAAQWVEFPAVGLA